MTFAGEKSAMYVYFVQAIIDGKPRIKIGKANNVEGRLGELRCGSPVLLSCIGSIACPTEGVSLRLERYAHEIFKEYRCHGEWFDLPPNWQGELAHLASKVPGLARLDVSAKKDLPIISLPPAASKTQTQEPSDMPDSKITKLWTETELAAYLGVCAETVERERRRGRLKFSRIAKKIRFTDGQIMEYLNSRECAAKDNAKAVTKLTLVK